MTRPFILARTFTEAKEIAHLAGLQGPLSWQYLSIHSARGTRGVPLLMTEDLCWRGARSDAADLEMEIRIADLKVTVVPCPGPDWVGFELPGGWNVPKSMYIQFGGQPLRAWKPKVSWWRRTWNRIRAGWS